MIDWRVAGRCVSALAGQPDRTLAALAESVRAAPCYQNTGFPLSPMPVFVGHAKAVEVVPSLERYVALLCKIIRLYREQPDVRAWYGLCPAAETLIAADRGFGDTVPVCRLDGYLEQGSERLRLLENNADAPAGTLFTPRINHIVRDVLTRVWGKGPAWSSLTFAAETALLDLLLGGLMAPATARVAILQLEERVSAESKEMARRFTGGGVDAFVADPRAVCVRGGRVYFGAERADVCWNKVNTVQWRTAVETDPALVRNWADAVATGGLRHVNPFAARYVAESKLTLALPREPRFTSLFDQAELDLVDLLVPWSVRLDGDGSTEDGARPLHEDMLDQPANYVVKQPYDIRGDGVVVGRAATRREWERAVTAARRDRLLVQRHVPPASYPVLRAGEEPVLAAMPISFDTFVFGGRVVGFGSKASFNARLNVFQGGRKLAVHVVDKSGEE
jgi:hypothetical protein